MNNWTDNLTDKDFRKVYIHPDIIKCKDCTSNKMGVCANIYSYPTMPEDFGCKNGQEKVEKEVIDTSIIDRIRCFFGFHGEMLLSVSQPFYQEMLFKCVHCGKYGIYSYRNQATTWYTRKELLAVKNDKSFEEMMEKYQL